MSFAATTALVAVFGALRDHRVPLGPRWAAPGGGGGDLLGGGGAGHGALRRGAFQPDRPLRAAGQPAERAADGSSGDAGGGAGRVACAAGARIAPLWVMGQGIAGSSAWRIGSAALEGARGTVPSPGPWVLPLLALGALILVLWQGRARWIGVRAGRRASSSGPDGAARRADRRHRRPGRGDDREGRALNRRAGRASSHQLAGERRRSRAGRAARPAGACRRA